MKCILTFLALLLSANLFATDIFVNQSITPGTVPNTYNTLTKAIDSSSDGDRILVAEGAYSDTYIINKSISILPQVSNTLIRIFGLIEIQGFPGMKVQLIGITCDNISSSTGSQTNLNKARIYIIDCNTTQVIDFNNNYYDLTCIRCNTSGISMKFGSVIDCKMSYLDISDEPGGGANNDTINKILIVADSIGSFTSSSDNYRCVIANNIITNIFYFRKWNYYTENINSILNNEFGLFGLPFYIGFASYSAPYFNIDFSNNKFNYDLNSYLYI